MVVYSYIAKNKENDKNLIVYICFFVWTIFVTFTRINTYWIILVMPFLIINIMVNSKFLSTNVLLETIGSFAYFIYDASSTGYIFRDPGLLSGLLFENFIPDKSILKYGSLYNMLQEIGINNYATIFSTVFITAFIIILVLSRPEKNSDDKGEIQDHISQGLLYARIGIIAFLTGLIIFSYTATTNPIAYTNLESENDASDISLLDEEKDYVITQEINFKDERELKELILKFHNERCIRNNFALVNVEIWNLSSNICTFNTSIGANSIEDEKTIKIKLNDAKVNSFDQYEIRLTGTKGNLFARGKENIYVYFTKSEDKEIGNVKVNGEVKQNSLYFQIR